ncbi:MAG: M14 family zinc carboxypeptidase [Gemmatimonadota bacterium]|nr:M14 family zinc carboxypeptidase [Gemmatimonadota bacterium]
MPVRRSLPLGFIFAVTFLASAQSLLGQQERDEEYTRLIREATTEEFFSTPLVDHLPASETVPTPLDHFGTIAGAPDVLHYPEEVNGYMRALAAASPRVEVFSMGESEEGREMILVVIGSEESIEALQVNKANLAALSDPRTTSPEQAEALFRTTKPIYWSTGAIHAPETGSPEMFMELAYRLAVGESDFIQQIRDGVIYMITPVVEVDGRAKVVDLHMGKRKDPDLNLPTRPLYWGKYVAHDNNRDNIGQTLALSRAVTRTYLEYHPTVFHDHHESASHLYTSTGRGPYNAWLDPIVINEWNRLAYKEVQDMTALGVPGVYTHDFYDGWGANYMMWVAHMRNSIGRFYETQGAGDASTRVITTDVERQWHRPSTPLREVVWGIRNNVNLQQSAVLIAMHEVSQNGEEFLRNFYKKSQRSVAKPYNEGPAAYVLPADDPRQGQQARLLQMMADHAFEVHRTEDDVTIGETTFPEGSYVVRMDQPYSRGADMLLDKQYYNPNDPRPYDDVGWTVGPLLNAEVVRVEDTEILEADMSLVRSIALAGGVEGGRGDTFLISYNADANLARFRFAHPELDIEAAESSFADGDREFAAGTFILRTADHPDLDLASVLDEAGRTYGFTAYRTRAEPAVDVHPVRTPRIAVVHTWTNTQDEGWLRFGLDEYGVPFDYISVHEVRDSPDLRSRYDVIVMGQTRGDALSMVRGLTGDEPIPWQASEVTPNIGRQDSTPDMRGGLGLEGVMHLKTFVEAGGVFVTMAGASQLPVHFGLADGVQIRSTPGMWARGGVFATRVTDESSPIAYGYDDLGVAFNTAPVFAVGGGGGGFGGFFGGNNDAAGRSQPGSTTGRRTGRGGIDEEDIVQGRPRNLGAEGVEAFRESSDDEDDDGGFGGGGPSTEHIRVVMRFAERVEDLLISGGLENGQPLADAPAAVDVPLGDGHVVMFSFNPFWRGHTHGSYALLFNTLMHHDALSVEADETVTDEDAPDPPGRD